MVTVRQWGGVSLGRTAPAETARRYKTNERYVLRRKAGERKAERKAGAKRKRDERKPGREKRTRSKLEK